MEYEQYKKKMDKETYFDNWKYNDKDSASMPEDIKSRIYENYLMKCEVFNRDSFKCQNVECVSPISPDNSLTIHHVKHKRNGGKDKLRNLVTICKVCHNNFNKGEIGLKLANEPHLPPNLQGGYYLLEKPKQEFNWKKFKSEMRQFRKDLKNKGLDIKEVDWEIYLTLFKWLNVPYNEYEDDI